MSEIPLFHVLNARITFGNVNGCSTAEETGSQNVEGTSADSGKKKKKSWALQFKKKIIAHIQLIYLLFGLTLEYLMK